MLCTSSETGEEVDLFRFIQPGKVTVCASSGVDIGLASEMEFTATVREIESITLDPLSGIWKRNDVDALPYGCRT